MRVGAATSAVLVVLTLASGQAHAKTDAQTRSRPYLVILAPIDGAKVEAPFPVRYRITGFRVGPEAGHMNVYTGVVGHSFKLEVPLTRTSGTVRVPDHPMLSGYRDITFVLVRADGSILTQPSARFRVEDVLISGSRSAGR